MIKKRINEFNQYLDKRTGGRLAILKNTLNTFSEARASQAAASLAYYAIFSLFPLLLALVSAASFFLDDEQVYQSVIQFVQNTLPTSLALIDNNLQQVLEARGTVGIISIITLLWSASGFFTSLAHNINLAWPQASRRNFLAQRLVGLGMIAGLSGLLIMSLILGWVASLIPFLNPTNFSFPNLSLWGALSDLGSLLTIFLLFLALYRWVPTKDVDRSATFWGALIASISWKLATEGFTWYLQSGLGRYQLVYGSLGAIIGLLFLIFIVSLITLFGAHLSAAIDVWNDEH